jgi:uncharacterized protein involved in exopolysaccharide biosynthesis
MDNEYMNKEPTVLQENASLIRTKRDDEVDFFELFRMIWDKRILIVSLTTVFAVVFFLIASLKTDIYEVKAVIEVGSFVNLDEESTSRESIEHVGSLVNKLHFIYNSSIAKKELTRLDKVQLFSGTDSLVELTVHSSSNVLATSFINKILNDTKQRHDIYLANYRENLDKELELLESKYQGYIEDKNRILQSRGLRNKRISSLINMNNDIAAVYSLNLVSQSDGLQLQAVGESIYQTEKNILNIGQRLKPHSLKETMIIGSPMIHESPIKPDRILHVMLGALIGMVVSLLLVIIISLVEKYKNQQG